jgi:hypothetical protein
MNPDRAETSRIERYSIADWIEMTGRQVKRKLFAGGCALLLSAGVPYAQAPLSPQAEKREEIYVLRSVRISRITPITVPNPEPAFLQPYSRIDTFFTR